MSAVSPWCMTVLHIAPRFVTFTCLQRAEICAPWGGEREESSAMPKKTKDQFGISCGSEGKMPERTKKINNLLSLGHKWFGKSLKVLHRKHKSKKLSNKSINRHLNLLFSQGPFSSVQTKRIPVLCVCFFFFFGPALR